MPRWLTWLTGALLAGLALLYAVLVVLSRPMSPDEGYVMITVQGFLDGHPLYDSVFTQYGPFFYFYQWVWHGLLGVPLTHDATRLLCVLHWLAAAGLLGAALGRLTRSALAGLITFTLAVAHLAPLANEPGHPQEVVAVLLGAGLLFATWRGGESLKLWRLGGVAVALAFTKINVGIFFGLALVFTLTCRADERLRRSIWPWLLAGACAALPLLLMRRHLDLEWCRNYALVSAGAVFTASLVTARNGGGHAGWSLCLKGVLALAVATVVLALGSIISGISPRGLVDGLLLTPLRMPGTALLPLAVPNGALVNALGAVAVAVWMQRTVNSPARQTIVTGLKTLFAAVALVSIGKAQFQLTWLLPWVWLTAIAGDETSPEGKFPRALLALAAAWQGLQAYPIAGTQVTIATVLLVSACVLCLADAGRALARSQKGAAALGFIKPQRVLLVQGVAAGVLVLVFAEGWIDVGRARREYDSLPKLGLPGSSLVRMDAEVTGMYRELSAYLRTECDAFVTYPGIHSLYFWSGKKPPTQLNSTGWGQLSHAQQEHILGALRESPRPRLVVVAAAAESWLKGEPEPIRPLVRSVREDWREVRRLGRFIIFAPMPDGGLTRRD